MIVKIGGIYQDANSRGFLVGLQRRLKCTAELLKLPVAVGKSREMTRKQARMAWRYFQKEGVDLIVRFTDADAVRWQNVQRHERNVFPEEAHSLLLCCVAVENVEHWLSLDANYIAKTLNVAASAIQDQTQRTGIIKGAIGRLQNKSNKDLSDLVADIVAEAPPEVFRKWLQDDALRRFYDDCRAAANRHDCEVTDELSNN